MNISVKSDEVVVRFEDLSRGDYGRRRSRNSKLSLLDDVGFNFPMKNGGLDLLRGVNILRQTIEAVDVKDVMALLLSNLIVLDAELRNMDSVFGAIYQDPKC